MHAPRRNRARAARALLALPLAAALSLGLAPGGSPGAAAAAAPAAQVPARTGAAGDAADPVYLGWTQLLPPIPLRYEPGSADECAAGRRSCVLRTLARLQERTDALAARCVHRAVFSLAYLRTTQAYLASVDTPGYFADPGFMNHYDRVFAEFYFDAAAAWEGGDRAHVPPAWRVAFEAADDRTVSALGDLLLGMNGHVNRDLPFVLAAIGLVAPDGSSRKPDHDRVDRFLHTVVAPLLDEVAERFDPGADDAGTPLGVPYTVLVQLLQGWREAAWRNAEALVAAPDQAARDAVSRGIEGQAAAQAVALRALFSYAPPLTSTASRDAYCAAGGAAGA